jgi:hypothetical protein
MIEFTPTDSLPMVINFRGDEPMAGDFSVSAEKAMDLLGIKRSRLNQISGRELRVAKMRVDGYVRPIYRLADVEEYLSWSRAPVTHKRSSEAIDDAVGRLESQAQELKDELMGEGNALHETVIRAVAILESSLSNQMKILRKSVSSRETLFPILTSMEKQKSDLSLMSQSLAVVLNRQREMEDSLNSIKGALAEVFVGLERISQRIPEASPVQSKKTKKKPGKRHFKTTTQVAASNLVSNMVSNPVSSMSHNYPLIETKAKTKPFKRRRILK